MTDLDPYTPYRFRPKEPPRTFWQRHRQFITDALWTLLAMTALAFAACDKLPF